MSLEPEKKDTIELINCLKKIYLGKILTFFLSRLLTITLVAKGVASVEIHEASFGVNGPADLLLHPAYDFVMCRASYVVRVDKYGTYSLLPQTMRFTVLKLIRVEVWWFRRIPFTLQT